MSAKCSRFAIYKLKFVFWNSVVDNMHSIFTEWSRIHKNPDLRSDSDPSAIVIPVCGDFCCGGPSVALGEAKGCGWDWGCATTMWAAAPG